MPSISLSNLGVFKLVLCTILITQAPDSRGTTTNTTGAKATSEINLLATLKPSHPRLLMDTEDWTHLIRAGERDSDLARVLARIQTDAAWLCEQPPLVYKKDGKRLLDVSRQGVQRILLWGVAYHLSGDTRFSDRAREELLNLARFQDWNPSHFLDVAEMTAAMAFGYDWFYANLDEPARAAVRQAIIQKGLKPGLDVTGKSRGWHRTENNWNQVCFGGLTLGALAVADEEPETAARILEAARKDIANGLKPYAPDGVYPEGPGYWEYGTEYQVLMIESLRSALDTDWDLPASPGFLSSAGVISLLTGPTGKCFNFFDGSERTGLQPAMFWFARELKDASLLRFQREPLEETLTRHVKNEAIYRQNRFFSLLALWWSRTPEPYADSELPLVWKGEGRNPVGVFRTSWKDPDALFLAFKGGAANLSHGHMDAGSFVLESDGVRWGVDLGSQSYLSLESKGVDLWNSRQDGGRWTVFRLNNLSHSTLTIDGQLHRVAGRANITEFGSHPHPQATIDLSPVFAGQAERVERRFELLPNRVVRITDKLHGLTPRSSVRWAMVTRASVTTTGGTATLKVGDKRMEAKLVLPGDGSFTAIPADPPEKQYNAPNPNTTILEANLQASDSGELTIEVQLQAGASQN